MAFADIMLPDGDDADRSWRMVEVKSSTSVKDYHRDDIAIQAFVALAAGVPLKSIAVAHKGIVRTLYRHEKRCTVAN